MADPTSSDSGQPDEFVPYLDRPEARGCWVACTALFAVVAALLVAAILFPFFARARVHVNRPPDCEASLKQLTLGIAMYAQDWDERLPHAHRWEERVCPYLANQRLFKCPQDESDAKSSYAMNSRFGGADTDERPGADELILLYDADSFGRPDPRHNGGLNCAFMDWHVKCMKGVPDQISTGPHVPPLSKDDGFWDEP